MEDNFISVTLLYKGLATACALFVSVYLQTRHIKDQTLLERFKLYSLLGSDIEKHKALKVFWKECFLQRSNDQSNRLNLLWEVPLLFLLSFYNLITYRFQFVTYIFFVRSIIAFFNCFMWH